MHRNRLPFGTFSHLYMTPLLPQDDPSLPLEQSYHLFSAERHRKVIPIIVGKSMGRYCVPENTGLVELERVDEGLKTCRAAVLLKEVGHHIKKGGSLQKIIFLKVSTGGSCFFVVKLKSGQVVV